VIVSATTVKKVLREEPLGPAGKRKGPSWREFLRAHAKSVIAVDFFTVDIVWLQRFYVLFFIGIASRRVYLAGCTAHPDGEWVTQQARHVAWTLSRADPVRFATMIESSRAVSMSSLRRKARALFVRRFRSLRRMGSRSGSFGRFDLNAWTGCCDPERRAPHANAHGIYRSLQWL